MKKKNTSFKKNERIVPIRKSSDTPTKTVAEEIMRLNKYIAHCGICSRRQAVELVKNGKVTVNGKVIEEPWYEVQPKDRVALDGKLIRVEQQKLYLLMNKPKNVITTVKDERGRKTVMDLLDNDIQERVFPVGRLDRYTTGLLLFTNDGELAQKLSHPSHRVKKIYYVALNKPLKAEDFEHIREGLTLEDGFVKVDGIEYIDQAPLNEVGVEIHAGRNRIVRRIFEHFGYEVTRLDRTYYAGLTKKNLPRGFFRHLTEREVIMLKHFV